MGFNFPNAPTANQVFTPAGGPTYIFVNGVWQTVSIPAPALPVQATAQARNRIVNPAMQISQENGNTAGASQSYYAADQFYVIWGSTTVVPSFQRVQSVTPNGSANRLRLTITTADATLTGSEGLTIETRIESLRMTDLRWGSAQAKQAIVRFGWRSPAGTYSFAIWAWDRSIWFQFTISAGQANTDTEQVFVVPPQTTGTPTTDFFMLQFCVAVGPSLQGGSHGVWGIPPPRRGNASNTNGIASAGAIFELFDIGLYPDPLNTGIAPPWQMPDEADEMLACQRYYQKLMVNFYSNVTAGLGYAGVSNYLVTPRAAPALSGVTYAAIGFFNTIETISNLGPAVQEFRTAQATGVYYYQTTVTANARM